MTLQNATSLLDSQASPLMLRRAWFLLPLLCLGISSPVPAQDAPSLEALQARYEDLSGLRAAFTQVTASEFADDSSQIEGRVLLAGDKYRVETPSQTVVTNGETTWIYSPVDSQVVVNDADADASTLTPQTFITASAEKYDVRATRSTQRDRTPHDVLSLSATTKSARFGEATLWVRRADRIVTRLRATDRNGSTLDLRLHEIDLRPDFADTPFTFSAPDGVEIVDLRADSSE
jgi:outer membrane lipoprotein carrier protein